MSLGGRVATLLPKTYDLSGLLPVGLHTQCLSDIVGYAGTCCLKVKQVMKELYLSIFPLSGHAGDVCP